MPRTSLILLGADPARTGDRSDVRPGAGGGRRGGRRRGAGDPGASIAEAGASRWRSCAETNPLFLLFVAALGVVVDAATSHGLQDDLAALLPTGTSLLSLLALAVIAAVLANLINNLPATLVLLAALGAQPGGRRGAGDPDRGQRRART